MRYTLPVALLAILCSLTACEPKAIDPDTGREMSAPEWAAQTERVRRQADADVQAAIATAKRDSDRMAAESQAAEQLAAAQLASVLLAGVALLLWLERRAQRRLREGAHAGERRGHGQWQQWQRRRHHQLR